MGVMPNSRVLVLLFSAGILFGFYTLSNAERGAERGPLLFAQKGTTTKDKGAQASGSESGATKSVACPPGQIFDKRSKGCL